VEAPVFAYDHIDACGDNCLCDDAVTPQSRWARSNITTVWHEERDEALSWGKCLPFNAKALLLQSIVPAKHIKSTTVAVRTEKASYLAITLSGVVQGAQLAMSQ
jgi:hypothetical protein